MEIKEINERNKKFLEKQGEEGKLLKRAFVAGYCRGLSLAGILLRKRGIKMDENEEQAFYFGQNCGVISFWIVLLVMIWVFIGG